MAKRDYAKVQAPSKSDSTANASILPAFAIVMVAAVCFAAGYWLGGEKAANVSSVDQSEMNRVQAELDSELANSKLLQVKVDELQDQIELLQNQARQGAHTKVGELKFYQELPKQSITPAPVAETSPAEARSMDGNNNPVLPDTEPLVEDPAIGHVDLGQDAHKVQIASFKTKSEAVIMQKKLMKAGVTSFVRKVKLDDRGVWFRVYAGPYADKESARKAVKDIQKKADIRGLIVRGN
ncbi:DedD protein [Mariprofundus micogutta]|uniref:DedD protein n=1 Tax=Mariprofundus micogutta TaxID=1921010 RepID=A0A1L8CM65_9PROT|nr:SPOR domain-containing protein [Mariprofundus micogutta]GAV19985.1 DedD protein [Mariprofundus micogutta]